MEAVSEPTKETHVCIGMFRPLFQDVLQSIRDTEGGSIPDPAEPRFALRAYFNNATIHERWLQGFFDEPVYKTHEEVISDQPK